MTQFELTILGCGSATPTSTSHPTAQLLKMAERYFLIDCGEGTQQQLRKYKVPFSKINHIFISHLHGDHYFGLVGLISSFHLMNREKPLHVYGPKGLQEIVELQLKYSNTSLVYPLHFHITTNTEKTLLFEDKRMKVFGFPLRHSIAVNGFLFEEKQRERNVIPQQIQALNIPVVDIIQIKKGADFIDEKGQVFPNEELTTPPPKPLKYAFCTDTAYMQKTSGFVAGVDLLYHESTFLQEDKNRAKKTKHATAKQAAKVAIVANVRCLLLGHFSVRYDSTAPFVAEAEQYFSPSLAAKEGLRVLVNQKEVITEEL